MKGRPIITLLFLLLIPVAPAVAAELNFAGTWQTTFGPMELKQEKDMVSGSYVMQGTRCSIEGTVSKSKLTFKYEEPSVAGAGWFELAADGKSFAGRWREDGTSTWYAWVGRRSVELAAAQKPYDGLWTSSFGRMRLVQQGDKVHGTYTYAAGSTVEGSVKDKRLTFKYNEPRARTAGEGWFEISDDGLSLTGRWKQDGDTTWRPWDARRVLPQPGVTWLVVIEARWEQGLNEREFSFGNMLKEFFARARGVQVRRRIFNDESDLRKWCREAAFLAEPVVICIATHGTSEGIQVDGRTIGPQVIADSLRYAGNVKLMHFSSCLMMKDSLAGEVMKNLGEQARFPISGYTTSVDWAASAVIEFMYFDLVMVRKMTPQQAAQQLGVLMPFSGHKPVPKAAIRSAGFKLLMPGETMGQMAAGP